MKKNIILRIALLGALILPLAVSTGCEDKYTGSEMVTRYYDIYPRDWHWNSIYGRYETLVDEPLVGSRLYRSGDVIGSVLINEEAVDPYTGAYWYETQQKMPFIQYLSDRYGDYQETITFFITDDGFVTFVYDNSDKSRIPAVPQGYTFKLTFMRPI